MTCMFRFVCCCLVCCCCPRFAPIDVRHIGTAMVSSLISYSNNKKNNTNTDKKGLIVLDGSNGVEVEYDAFVKAKAKVSTNAPIMTR